MWADWVALFCREHTTRSIDNSTILEATAGMEMALVAEYSGNMLACQLNGR